MPLLPLEVPQQARSKTCEAEGRASTALGRAKAERWTKTQVRAEESLVRWEAQQTYPEPCSLGARFLRMQAVPPRAGRLAHSSERIQPLQAIARRRRREPQLELQGCMGWAFYRSFSAKGRPKSRTFPVGDSTLRASGNSKWKVVPRPISDLNSI